MLDHLRQRHAVGWSQSRRLSNLWHAHVSGGVSGGMKGSPMRMFSARTQSSLRMNRGVHVGST